MVTPQEAATMTKSDRLRLHLLAMIDSQLEPHDKVPPERDLAEEFDVSRMTVRGVLGRLENEGRVYRVQGSGTFVSESRISKSVELTSFTEDMRARGFAASSRLVAAEECGAGTTVGFALGMSPMARVVHLRRVRLADDAPMALEDAYFPADLVPGMLNAGLEGSIYQLLEDRYRLRVESADQSIRVTALEPQDAELLAVPAYSPAFLVLRTGRDPRGRAVEYASSVYRGDRYSYELTVHRTARVTEPEA